MAQSTALKNWDTCFSLLKPCRTEEMIVLVYLYWGYQSVQSFKCETDKDQEIMLSLLVKQI